MPHTHHLTAIRHLTLTLPTVDGRYELCSVYACPCGISATTTSWARQTGCHLTYAELKTVARHERVHGARETHPDERGA